MSCCCSPETSSRQAQDVLEAWGTALEADVVKVPSPRQLTARTPSSSPPRAPSWRWSAPARDNDYGHPAPQALALLAELGMEVARTDLLGDVAVVVEDGELVAVGE
jgi:competence protein ComEC